MANAAFGHGETVKAKPSVQKFSLFMLTGMVVGSMVGAVALYYVGVVLGRDRVRAMAARLPLAKVSDIDRTETWFARHGVKTVFFGRMIPMFRSLISIPAGVERMPMATLLRTRRDRLAAGRHRTPRRPEDGR